MKPNFVIIALIYLCACANVLAQGTGEEKPDEVQVNVLPKKGLKFDPKAIYREDQAVLQGIFGTNGDDEINALEVMPSKCILAAGKIGTPQEIVPAVVRSVIKGLSGTGNAFVAVFDPAFRNLEKIAFMPPEVATLRFARLGKDGAVYLGGDQAGNKGLVVLKIDANFSQLIWKVNTIGDFMTGMAVMPDNSVVVSPSNSPFISHIRSDGGGLIPFGKEQYFRTDAANPQVFQKYYVELGYKAKGMSISGYNEGGTGGVAVTADGNLVYFTTNRVRDRGGEPDFDPMLLKFTTAGEIIWITNLVQGLPAPSDQKNARMYVDHYSGDLILACNQHGHFGPGHDLIVTPGCYLTTDSWLSGDVFLGWIGRIDAETGKVKAATMYFPDLQSPPIGGRRTANSLFIEGLCTDQPGRIYLVGAAAYKLATTPNAFQPEPLGGDAFLSVFDPNLTTIIYASFITAQGYGVRAKRVTVTDLGPVVSSQVTTGKGQPYLVTANTEKTNFMKPNASGMADIMLSLFPSKNWFEDSQ